ncbi:hypothetical protein WR25_21470 [Diploscapter pachys]|uniref:Uncharacterized protein n=1 Tax=Diploscapter pachys TaxID=2018661 RepID=A0A2A2JER5_9BILA|nr:hypothetical protein WR25_21470 [Diploscapter pachys]
MKKTNAMSRSGKGKEKDSESVRRATTGSVSSTSSDLYLDAPPPVVQQPVTSTPSESLAVSAQAANNSGGEKSGQLRSRAASQGQCDSKQCNAIVRPNRPPLLKETLSVCLFLILVKGIDLVKSSFQ